MPANGRWDFNLAFEGLMKHKETNFNASHWHLQRVKFGKLPVHL